MLDEKRKKAIWLELCKAADVGDLRPKEEDELSIVDFQELMDVAEHTARAILTKLEKKEMVTKRWSGRLRLYKLTPEAHQLIGLTSPSGEGLPQPSTRDK